MQFLIRSVVTSALLIVASTCGHAQDLKPLPADHIYLNGEIFTSETKHPMASALAVRDGKIVYVGSNEGAVSFIGSATVREDLHGRFLMPGLIDGHMHPFDAGHDLIKCNLNYESLTVEEFKQKVQTCLDQTKDKGPDQWLEVVNWFQESMRPSGVKTNHQTLDGLSTSRPIIVRSSFGHTVLANQRALDMANITASTPEPKAGKIWRDAANKPTGLLEDSAFEVFDSILPKSTPEQDIQAAAAALKAMNAQGITSFLEALTTPESLAAFSALKKSDQLTARGHFTPLIDPKDPGTPDELVGQVSALVKKFDGGDIVKDPGITVRNAKLFLDGVISAPALTGAVLEPYRINTGTAEHPHWAAGTDHGPDIYFPEKKLAALLIALGKSGIDPHMHADGDGAVHAALNGIAAMRKALPNADIRPAIAHDEIVAPSDLKRYKQLNAIPVLSFQWEKPGGDTLGLTDYFGPERMKILEPAGILAQSGARIAYGSDWPVDALNEWFALKVGVTRSNTPDAAPEYKGRLGTDPGLSPEAVLRAITINSAYELHQDQETGSLEVGKLADLIVLDRNPLKIPHEDIANTKVLKTVVGGKVVYETPQ